MAVIIEFASRAVVKNEPSRDLDLDWVFDDTPHEASGRMIRISVVARADAKEQIFAGFMRAYGAYMAADRSAQA